MSMHEDIEAYAAEWIAREDGGTDPAGNAAFETWLAESMAHRVAYLRLKAAWDRADRLAALRAPRPPQPMLRREKPPVASILPRLAAGLIALAVTGAVLAWMNREGNTQQTFATELGAQKTVALADGSQVELNTETTLRADLSHGRRAVWLDSGEAYFSVAHDAKHPFVVMAGNRSVTVLGTKFSVRRDGDRLDVLVEQGRVKVADASRLAVLLPGDTVEIDDAAMRRAHESAQEIEDALGWRRGLIVFDRSTLAAAVAEFNRYNRVKLVVADAKAAGLRIGGTFGCTNTAGFVRLLQSAFRLHAALRGQSVIISS